MKNFLIALLTLFILSQCAPTNEDKSPKSSTSTLKDAYKDAFRIGTALSARTIATNDSTTHSIIQTHFSAITPENCMKAGLINPKPGEFNFGPADEFVAYGKANDMFIIGHTLVWHNQTPEWFFKDDSGQQKSQEAHKHRLHDHIQAIAGRYAGQVDAWDVVNEVIDNDGAYRPTTWVNGVGNGDTLVKLSFEYAAKYAPNTELYYNDFNAWRPEKRDGIARMIRMLQAEGIRIDGVGIQAHWGLNFPKNEYIEAAIDTFANLGVKVMITELDVDVLPLTKEGQIIGTGMFHPQFQLEEFEEFLAPYQNELPENVQQELSDRYAELFDIFYKKKDKIDRVTLWGYHDGMSWKNDYPIPNRTNYPALWDRELKAKPALDAVLSVSGNR